MSTSSPKLQVIFKKQYVRLSADHALNSKFCILARLGEETTDYADGAVSQALFHYSIIPLFHNSANLTIGWRKHCSLHYLLTLMSGVRDLNSKLCISAIYQRDDNLAASEARLRI